MSTAELYWLPVDPNWNAALPSIGDTPDSSTWAKLVGLANARLDLVRTIRLDRHLLRMFGDTPPPGLTTRPVRLAVLGSSTVDHFACGDPRCRSASRTLPGRTAHRRPAKS